MLYFNLLGTFRLIDEDEGDRRPKLMKSRAILATLALTKGHVRSRSWLQALLWPNRQTEQAQSSLRTSLADIRRHLGHYSDIVFSDHNEIGLDVSRIRTDLNDPTGRIAGLLEGFDVPNAPEFDAWLDKLRKKHELTSLPAQSIETGTTQRPSSSDRLFLGSICPPAQSMTQMQADALMDNLAKSAEDLGLSQTTDIRGRAKTQSDYVAIAQQSGCDLLLLSETAETGSGSMIRLKILEPSTTRLLWSKSLTKDGLIDLDDPATIVAVAEFIDILAEITARTFDIKNKDLPASVIGMAGVKHMFKLGSKNYKIADELLKAAFERDSNAIYLAWRGYLRTYFIAEQDYDCRSSVIEEGTFLSKQAIEIAPHNSMVLAAGAHVATMLQDSYEDALMLAGRALDLNRSNPFAWSTFGLAQSFLGNSKDGKANAKIGAKLAGTGWHSAQLEGIAGSASLLDDDIDSARRHSEVSHLASSSFAPPLRFLSAIYCHDGQFERAKEMANKLRLQEPDFSLEQLKDDGYPANSLRKAGLLSTLPVREI